MIVNAKNTISLGRLGENEATVVCFSIKSFLDECPNASFVVLHKRPCDINAYPVSNQFIQINNNNLYWTVQSGDLTCEGSGQCELIASDNGKIIKSVIYRTIVYPSLDENGTPPEPWESWVQDVESAADRAESAAELLEHPSAEATTLEPGLQATASYLEGVFTFGIPTGTDGKDGKDGADGKDGKDGADGKDGQDGQPGQDGFSPVATVSKSGSIATISITDSNGTTTAQISDGQDGQNGQDGQPGVGVPSGGTDGQMLVKDGVTDYATKWVNQPTIPTVPVTDVQVNNASILSQGVANVPIADTSSLGVIKPAGMGVNVNSSNGEIYTTKATSAKVKAGTANYDPIVPAIQHESVFYGLAKAAGDTSQDSSANAVGSYTADALVKIQKMLGVYKSPWELIREDTVTNATEDVIDITVDGNGNAFQLTDVVLMFETPQQANEAKKAGYGAYYFYYKDTNSNIAGLSGTWTQAANASANGCVIHIEDNDDMIFVTSQSYSSSGNANNLRRLYKEGFSGSQQSVQLISDFYVHKVSIPGVTGTGHYKLYGKRKPS